MAGLIIALVLSVIINLVVLPVLYKFGKKLVQFDNLFELMSDEINSAISFFEKLLQKPLFMASPEIEEAHVNMNLLRHRLKELVAQMGELQGKDVDPPILPSAPSARPPVVVD